MLLAAALFTDAENKYLRSIKMKKERGGGERMRCEHGGGVG
jgi:hypothetical protein